MFYTKTFTLFQIRAGELDKWLNSFRTPGYGVRIVNSTNFTSAPSLATEEMAFTISVWRLSENPNKETRSTIDEIPEEPSICYPQDDESHLD